MMMLVCMYCFQENQLAQAEIPSVRALLEAAQNNPFVDIPLRKTSSNSSLAFLRMTLRKEFAVVASDRPL